MKTNFFKTKHFKLFLTIWIIYIFYLQMFGTSSMANSQLALTAAIANEGRFEIDTYYRVSTDIAFYNGHYYSGQPPGISFISVPFYILSKPFFYLIPQNTIDSLFEKLENYGESLPVDHWGNKKIISNYFSGLSKRQILEFLFISGFVLPIFATALITALSSVLVYMVLKRFTKNEKLRLFITLFYAFGTILFRSSTLYLERPIAIALMFAAFIILLKVRHKELKPKGAIFAAGMLAGFSAWFDYYSVIVSGLLFLYLLSFYLKSNYSRTKNLWILDINKQKLLLLLNFIIAALIPLLLLSSYHYIIFDDPFTTTYAHKTIPGDGHKISGIFDMKLPTANTLLHMSKFLLYSPIILFALFGLYKAFLKKDAYYHDALAVAVFVIFTLVYNSILTFSYPSTIAEQFFRYMTPILPFTIIFLPYVFTNTSPGKKKAIKILFYSVGIISILINWATVQYDRYAEVDGLDEKQFIATPQFLENGPSSSFLRTTANVFHINSLLLNLIGLSLLALVIFLIWRPYLVKKFNKE